jgi:predicted O-methyltransferase YrrM
MSTTQRRFLLDSGPISGRSSKSIDCPVFLLRGSAKLPTTKNLRAFYLSHLSTPHADRLVYKAIQRRKSQRILEIGIGIGQRSVRMIETATLHTPADGVSFIGIDLFEARSAADGPGVPLKMVHRLLKRTGAAVQLIPGDAGEALARSANALGTVDLIVISARLDPQSLRRAWYYVPRLLHRGTQVFMENILPGGNTSMQLVSSHQINHLATATTMRRAA